MKFILYLLQVSACTGIFYLFYYLVLKGLTFFTLNRWYLSGSLLLSFIIPLVTLPPVKVLEEKLPVPVLMTQEVSGLTSAIFIQKTDLIRVESGKPIKYNQRQQNKSINYIHLGLWLYFSVSGLLILRLAISLLLFFRRLKTESITRIGSIRIIRHNRNFKNGSFFNFIFISANGLSFPEVNQIIAHELVHVRQLHSIDKLLAKSIQVVLWFNPFIYAYLHAVEENHEFAVDKEMVKQVAKKSYAELLLRLVTAEGRLLHHFSQTPLKNRVHMLFTKPSQNMKKLVYLLCLPLVGVSLFSFAKRPETPIINLNSLQEVKVLPSPIVGPAHLEKVVSEKALPVNASKFVPKLKKKHISKAKPQPTFFQTSSPLSDYQNAKKVREYVTTLAEVLKLFGEPTKKEVSAESTFLYYEEGPVTMHLSFTKENIVSDFIYSYKNPNASPSLTVDKIRLIKENNSTEADIKKLFGEPSRLAVGPNNVLMVFLVENGSIGSTLDISFHTASNYVVGDYSFGSWNKNLVSIIDPEKLENLKEGKNTMFDVEKDFGIPGWKIIDVRGEVWTYQSPVSHLEIIFGKENTDKISEFKFTDLSKLK